jgi:acyl-coenzyme A synthetase/AMP-(fatty) acid ligase
MNFSDILLNANPDQDAYVFCEKIYSIKEIQKLSWIKTNALFEKNIKPQQRVLLLADDSIDWVSTFWALSIIGCCIIVLNYTTAHDKIKDICNKHKINTIITDQLAEFEHDVIDIGTLNTSNNYQIIPYNYGHQEPFFCSATSGTNGAAKFTVHSNRSLASWGDIITDFYSRNSLVKNSTMICPAKLSFTIGFMNNIIGPMFVGTRSVIGVTPIDLKKIDQLCEKFSVSAVMVTPYFLEFLLSTSISKLPDTLNCVITGGEPLSDFLAEQFFEKFNKKLINCYGLSETCVNVCELSHHSSKSIGRPLNTVDIKIVNDQNIICDINEIGTLFIKTPAQLIGYLDDPKSNSEVMIDGWINTRDLVSLSDTGDLLFHGRLNSCVKHKGQWVSLLEIEHKILEIPGVKNCVVLQDSISSSEIVALIVKDTYYNVDIAVVQEFLLKHFRKSYLSVNSIKFVNEIPKTVNTKQIRNYSVIKDLIVSDVM